MNKIREWVIGRTAQCDVVVDEAVVSGRHCRLIETDQGFVLEDLQSSNGTFVNGARVTTSVLVCESDRITLGQSVLMPWPVSPAQTIISIGRDTDNDVVLDYSVVSGHHARILVSNGQARIVDLGSTNGTALGHPDRRVAEAPLEKDDVVYFGSVRVPAGDLLRGMLGRGGDRAHQKVSFAGHSIVFGRDPACEEVLSYPMVSWRHARLYRSGTAILLEDLGSTNGTFLNGRRLIQPAPVKPGDLISLGSFTFQLNGEGALEKRNLVGNLTLEARHISVNVAGKRLIEDVSFTIFASEFVGLMGPSGAGKTTLMNAVNGYTRPTEGSVLLNGGSLYTYYRQFAPYLGYVPQDDIIHRDLTVGQALYYSARLRLPRDYCSGEIHQRIREVLARLDLQGTEKVLVGSPEKKGISGGQRKRVNLAMELLTDPVVLYLDEPTSGLSSEDALTVMKLLRQLADTGKTILLTIHQPSLEAFRLLDNLAVISKDANSPTAGNLVYYGPAYPDAIHFFNPNEIQKKNEEGGLSPDQVLRGLSKARTVEWEQRYRAAAYHRKYVEERASSCPPVSNAADSIPGQGVFSFSQWWTLVRRSLAIKVKDTWNTLILAAQAPVVAMLIVMVYGQQVTQEATADNWFEVAGAVSATVFLMVLAALWFGCSNAVREIVGEWAIYRRERMVNLRLLSYIVSKYTVLGGLCVLQCAALVGIVAWGCQLKASLWVIFGFSLLSASVGLGFGLLISAVSKSSEVAVALVPLILLPMVILGGLVQPIHKMHFVTRAVCAGVASRWAFEGMLVAESNHRSKSVLPDGLHESASPAKPVKPQLEQERLPEDMAECYFPRENGRSGVGASVAMLCAMFLGLFGLSYLTLRARDIH